MNFASVNTASGNPGMTFCILHLLPSPLPSNKLSVNISGLPLDNFIGLLFVNVRKESFACFFLMHSELMGKFCIMRYLCSSRQSPEGIRLFLVIE
jgi:hypothetical protein